MQPNPNSEPSKAQNYSPILGLPVDDEPESAPQPAAQDDGARLELSVIVPARNEEANLPACLASLLAQDDKLFQLNVDWELWIVDDESTDRTYAIADEAAAGHDGVHVMSPPKLELRAAKREFTGKNNACWAAAQQAQGRWLLFTDADTIHEPGDLERALHEAKKHEAALLSYSPQQMVSGFWQRALMPLVFSELATVYPMAEVNDPARKLAAANGQFLMVERKAYFAVGGHKAVGTCVLEDVELAYNVKRSKRKLRFRYAPDALSTRMYRGFRDMVEGWTKNLALLFPHALSLAAWRVLDIALLLLPLLFWVIPYLLLWQQIAILALWARTLLRFYRRVARSNFGFVNCAISVLALPLFIYLLLSSWMRHKLLHQVSWKGREYRTGNERS
ncbi:MAG TPA: glycosyltransferase family 2 protein [Acidobacteriaceae bacterium]